MEKYFGINYSFDKEEVKEFIRGLIRVKQKGYVCVADGFTLAVSQKDKKLKEILDNASLTVCDSGWVPLYLKLLYGINKEQYSGAELLENLVKEQSFRMMFLGTSPEILDALRQKLIQFDPNIKGMIFESLPFKHVDEFDYPAIAAQINKEIPDIIWISLGMPKQEYFMHHLTKFINQGVLIGVGAAFKFHSGISGLQRAPGWMIKMKLEWVYRIWREPKKQLKRCIFIIQTLPAVFWREYRMKNKIEK